MIIEKGKPFSDTKAKHAPTLKKMDVGDSIVVDEHFYNSIYVWFRRNGKKCKRLKEKGGRVRIWRVD